jgi:hypothetical protein
MERLGRDFDYGKLTEKQVTGEYLKLKNKFTGKQDEGEIYLQLANTLETRTRKPNADNIIRYAKMAAAAPLDPLNKIRAYALIGDGLRLQSRNLKGADWAHARRQVVEAYLHGLKIALDNITEARRQPLPAVGSYVCVGDKTKCGELKAAHDAQVAKQSHIRVQNHLIDAREALLTSCFNEYASAPHGIAPANIGDLERAANEILTPAHNDVTKKLLTKVMGYRTAREQGEKTRRERTEREQHAIPPRQHIPSDHVKKAKPKIDGGSQQ